MALLARLGDRFKRRRPVSRTALRIRADARGDRETARRYKDAGPDMVAAEGILQAAFELSLRRKFGPAPDLRTLNRFVVELMRRYEPPRMRAIDIEAVVRSAFDDEVSLEGIDRRTHTVTQVLAAADALAQSGLSDAELDELLYDA